MATSQACLEDRIPNNPAICDKMALKRCVWELPGPFQGAAPVSSTPKSCPHGKLQPSLLASIQDEITPEEPDKAEVKSHKGSCSDAQAIHLKRSVTYQVKKWKDEQWSDYRVCTIHMYTSHTHTRKRKEMSRFSIIFIGILIQHIRTMQNYAPAYQTE